METALGIVLVLAGAGAATLLRRGLDDGTRTLPLPTVLALFAVFGALIGVGAALVRDVNPAVTGPLGAVLVPLLAARVRWDRIGPRSFRRPED